MVNYKQRLEEIRKRLQAIETEKAALLQAYSAFETLAREQANLVSSESDELPELDLSGTGLTDAIRSILEARGPMQATEVRDMLHDYGYVGYGGEGKNLLISVHTVLRRLIKSGEVDEVKLSGGQKGFRYVSEAEHASREAMKRMAAPLMGINMSEFFESTGGISRKKK